MALQGAPPRPQPSSPRLLTSAPQAPLPALPNARLQRRDGFNRGFVLMLLPFTKSVLMAL